MMASTRRLIPFSKYLQVRAALVSHPHTKLYLSLWHSWQMRGGEIAQPCQLVLSMGPGGDARKQKSFYLSWAKAFAPRPQRAMAEVLQAVLFLLALLTLPPAQEDRCWAAEPCSRVSLGALGRPSPTLGSVTQLSAVQSLAQLSAVPSKLSLKAKVLYLEMYGQDRKESLFLFLQKMQEATRGEKNLYPSALWRNPLIQKWEGITRILLI